MSNIQLYSDCCLEILLLIAVILGDLLFFRWFIRYRFVIRSKKAALDC